MGAATVALFASLNVSYASTYYVDATSRCSRNCGTSASPFQEIWQAQKVVKAGDTISVGPGTYYDTYVYRMKGTATAPIRFVGTPGSVKTNLRGKIGAAIMVNQSSYISIENFDISSPGDRKDAASGRHGVAIQSSSHVTVNGNDIHDSGLNGVSAVSSDYVTVTDNYIYGNAYNTGYMFASGISIYGSVDVDNNTKDYKNIISGNVVYGNSNVAQCATVGGCAKLRTDTDGHGIIIDDNRHQQNTKVPYKGRTLITNNYVIGNGGRGIYTYSSLNTTIVNNTALFNNQDPNSANWNPGEIAAGDSGNIIISNNVVYSTGATMPNGMGVRRSYDFDSNIAPVLASGNIGYNALRSADLMTYRRDPRSVVTFDATNSFVNPSFTSLPSIPTWNKWLNTLTINVSVSSTSRAVRFAKTKFIDSDEARFDMFGTNRLPSPNAGAMQATSDFKNLLRLKPPAAWK